MADSIEAAPTGRAKCKGCGGAIVKGEFRFGEVVPNAYGEGESKIWFHPVCAAFLRPEKFLECARQVPSDSGLLAIAELAERTLEHPRLARIDKVVRDPSGRAHCRHCKELMPKGSWRIALRIFEESRYTPIGFIHVACAAGYFANEGEQTDTGPLGELAFERIRQFSRGLSDDELQEVAAQLR